MKFTLLLAEKQKSKGEMAELEPKKRNETYVRAGRSCSQLEAHFKAEDVDINISLCTILGVFAY